MRCGFHGSDSLYVGINGTVSDLSGLLYPGTHGDVLIEVWLSLGWVQFDSVLRSLVPLSVPHYYYDDGNK